VSEGSESSQVTFHKKTTKGGKKKTSCDAGGRVTAIENDQKRCESDNVIEIEMSITSFGIH
jgi:hypothetical protein